MGTLEKRCNILSQNISIGHPTILHINKRKYQTDIPAWKLMRRLGIEITL